MTCLFAVLNFTYIDMLLVSYVIDCIIKRFGRDNYQL